MRLSPALVASGVIYHTAARAELRVWLGELAGAGDWRVTKARFLDHPTIRSRSNEGPLWGNKGHSKHEGRAAIVRR